LPLQQQNTLEHRSGIAVSGHGRYAGTGTEPRTTRRMTCRAYCTSSRDTS
jgi:hypothetical protein